MVALGKKGNKEMARHTGVTVTTEVDPGRVLKTVSGSWWLSGKEETGLGGDDGL